MNDHDRPPSRAGSGPRFRATRARPPADVESPFGWASYPELMSALRDEDAQGPQPDWHAMEQQLLHAFGDRQATARPPRWRWVAVAATLVVAAGAAWQLMSSAVLAPTTRPIAAPPVTTPEHAAAETASPARQIPAMNTPIVAQVIAPVPARTARPARAAVAKESAVDPLAQFAGFVMLPGVGTLPDFESGHVVRIDVPPAGLPAYGLDLLLDAVSASVEADLLVGQDGVPRAIRLASTNQ